MSRRHEKINRKKFQMKTFTVYIKRMQSTIHVVIINLLFFPAVRENIDYLFNLIINTRNQTLKTNHLTLDPW